VSAVTGIAAPRATPVEIVERLNAEINTAYADAAEASSGADSAEVEAPLPCGER